MGIAHTFVGKAMPGGLSRRHLMPARLTRLLFIVSMALSLLRVGGFASTYMHSR